MMKNKTNRLLKITSLIIVFLFYWMATISPTFAFFPPPPAPPAGGTCVCVTDDDLGSNGIDPSDYYCSDGCVAAIAGKPCSNNFDCSVVTSPSCTACSIIDFIGVILLPWVFGIGVFLAIIFLVIGAIRYMTAGDDQKKITDAKGTVTWSIIGFTVIVLAAAIIRLIWVFFGFDEGKIFFIPTQSGEGGVTEPVLDCTMCQQP